MKDHSKKDPATQGSTPTPDSAPDAHPHTPAPDAEAPSALPAGASQPRRRPPGKSAPSAFWNRLFPYQNMNALEAVDKLGKRRKKK